MGKTTRTFVLLAGISVWLSGAIVVLAATPQADNEGASRAVIVATQRDHRVQIFDADSLMPLGSVVVNGLASGVVATPSGETLFVAAAQTKDGNVCCAVFALRLAEPSICSLLYPALQVTVAPDGERVFLQRGNTGIDVFSTRTLAQLPTIRGPGVYHLMPSPDGRWLFGITSFQGPSLDIFSLTENRMVRRLPLPAGRYWDGAWIGKRFFLLAHDGRQGQVWTVQAEDSPQGPKFCKHEGTCVDRPVALPDLRSDGKPVGLRVSSSGQSLIAYEPLSWWFKVDRRNEVKAPFPGGIFKIDPVSGKLLAHLAPEIDFAQVVADPSGQFLYAIEAGRAASDNRVHLLKLDSSTGQVAVSRPLATDVWSISFAELRPDLIPRSEIQPGSCKKPTPAAE